jgi:hypothetical protein
VILEGIKSNERQMVTVKDMLKENHNYFNKENTKIENSARPGPKVL